MTGDVPTTALAVAAHPDDIEFGAGATLAKWAAAGCEVHLLVCTDGSKGSWDPSSSPAELVVTRQAEQRAAAQALGATGQVVFLGWPDGELESGIRQRWEVAHWIRALRPQVLLGHDPWKRYRLHPDHRHAGLLTVEALVAAREPHVFTEQANPPHRPDELWLFEADEPDHLEDVEGFVEAKIAALEAHRSQLRSTMGVDERADDATAAAQLEVFRARIRAEAAAAGRPDSLAAAEAFRRLTDT